MSIVGEVELYQHILRCGQTNINVVYAYSTILNHAKLLRVHQLIKDT